MTPVRSKSRFVIPGLAASLLLSLNAIAAKAPPRKPNPAPAAPVAAPAPAEIGIPRSIYQAPANTREGRNPFFPETIGAGEVNPVAKPAPENLALVLNGITGPPKRTAMVNGRTLEEGETADVKVGDRGRVRVQCVQIKDDSVVILVAGQRRELRLRAGI